MSLRIRPPRLEALECRLAPASMSSLLHHEAAGLGWGHSLDVASRDDAPRGLSVAALARGFSESSARVGADVNVSKLGVGTSLSLEVGGLGTGVSLNVSVEVRLTPTSRPTTNPVVDVEASVGTGTNTTPVKVSPVVVPPVTTPPVSEPPSGEVTGPAQPPAATVAAAAGIPTTTSARQAPTVAAPNTATVTPARTTDGRLVNAVTNQTAATASLSQTPATPFLFLSPAALAAQQLQQQLLAQQQAAVPILRVDVVQPANVVVSPPRQTLDFAVGGGDVPDDAVPEQMQQPPMAAPRGDDTDPAKLGLEATPPELGVNGNQADDADGEEGARLMAGFVGEGGLPSWLVFVIAVSALAVSRLAVPLPRRRPVHLLLADDLGRFGRPE
jgi:hypothetical protein